MLDKLRREISSIDTQIAELVAQRQDLARRIGAFKETHGLPVRDFGIEKRVLDRMRRRADAVGVDPTILHEVALALIRGAVGLQEVERTREQTGGDTSCTIVGGAGKMGGWFTRFANSLGYATHVVEKDDLLDESITRADLVVLAVPLAAMREVLVETLALEPRGVVLEIASLKSHLTDVIEDGVKRGLQVAGIHPMFGPDKDLLAGQNVVVCRAGCPTAEQKAVDLFRDTAAHLTELPLAEHDRYMTWVLNLPHLVNLAMGETLRGSGLSYERLEALGGTTFSQQMRVTAEVMSENPELYYHIQHINRHRGELYTAFGESIDRLAALSAADDSEGFGDMMADWAQYSTGSGDEDTDDQR